MRVAIFDYRIQPTNPIGGCHLRMLRGLCAEHEFTVFAVEFENPCPDRIHFVRVRVPRRPLAVLFVAFHLVAPVCYWLYRLRRRVTFDVIQSVESNCSIGTVAYAHFCHRAFLKYHWRELGATGLRGRLRWLDHWLHALLEPIVYRRVGRIVVPSGGLARELSAEFPWVREKITVIPNPVDYASLQPPPDFDRTVHRATLGLAEGDLVLVFAALGHFERKGLPHLLQALQRLSEPRLKLVVVGGERGLVSSYRDRAAALGLAGHVVFAGVQRDLRPYLWSADALALPSYYETFSLVAFEAAGAGLPLIVAPVHGVDDILKDGENGFVVGRSAEQVAQGITRLIARSPEERTGMGEEARRAVASYDLPHFIARWREFYASRRVA